MPKLSTACAGVYPTLPTMTSHGAYRWKGERIIVFSINKRWRYCHYTVTSCLRQSCTNDDEWLILRGVNS